MYTSWFSFASFISQSSLTCLSQGDVSNRRSTRSAQTTKTRQPAANGTLVLEQVTSVDDKAPNRRRSSRSCVVTQRVKPDESVVSFPEDTDPKPKTRPSANKASHPVQDRGRSAKRCHEEPTKMEPKTKKSRRSTSTSRKAAAVSKKPSKFRSERSTSRRRSSSGPRKPCSAFLTETNYGLVRVPFDSSKFTLGIAPHDQAQKDDVLEVSNYATDIFQRLYFAEVRLS